MSTARKILSYRRTGLFLAAMASLLAWSPQTLGVDACASTLFRSARGGYVRYTKVLPRILVRDQDSSTCWAFTGNAFKELVAIARPDIGLPPGTRLSMDFLLYGHLRLMIREAPFKGIAIAPENLVARPAVLFSTIGALPEGIWEPKADLNMNFDETVEELSTLYAKYAPIISHELEVGRRDLALETSRRFIRTAEALLEKRFGVFPTNLRFPVGDREMSPLQLGKALVGDEKYVRMVNGRGTGRSIDPRNQARDLAAMVTEVSDEKAPVVSGPSDILTTIKYAIDNERPVAIAIRWVHDYIDTSTGVISFDNRLRLDPYKVDDEKYEMHAVLVTGYKEGSRGIEQLLVLNSHGEFSGDGGYFHMQTPYFERFISDALVQLALSK